MADEIALELATPERLLLKEPVSDLQVPGRSGYMGILPGHAPLLSELAPGVLTFTSKGGPQKMAVLGGFVEVLPDRVRILADAAVKKDEINLEQARQELAKAQAALGSAVDPDAAVAEVERATALVNAGS